MKNPIRILNLFTIMNRGGAETMVMNYYRNIDRTKLQFDFMVHREERGAYDDEIESLGGKIYRMPPIRPWTASNYKKTVRQFYKQHPEYQIIHAHMSELGYYDFTEAERAGVPVRIGHAHNRAHGFDFKSPVRWYYKTRMMPHITHMFMCGEESGECLFGNKNKEHFIQMNNAIDAEKYIYNSAKREIIRKELGISDDQIVVGHVGRFDPQKNHKFIIDIFAEVQKQDKNAVLMLVGDDSSTIGKKIHQKVDQLGLQNVIFTGVRSDVADLMQAMDVFLFPSLFEGFGIVALEAQAAGMSTIVSNRIPSECFVTDLIKSVELSNDSTKWSSVVLEAAKIQRRNTFEEIKNAGFDIKENAKWLQEFYINVANGGK